MPTESPPGWSVRSFGSFTTPVNRTAGEAQLPVLSVSKILGIVPQSQKFKKRVASRDTSRYRRVRSGEFAYDPMLLWDGSISRMTCVEEGVISPAYEVFAADGSVDHSFLLQLVKSKRMVRVFRNTSVGTNVRRRQLDYKTFAKIAVTLPPLPVQAKIAAILSSVDEAIQATEAVIEQTRRVKDGLLQDLLTKGIGHTRFQKTEIGEIPEGWEAASVGTLLHQGELAGVQDGNHGERHPKAVDYVDAGVPFVMARDLLQGRINLQSCAFITPEQAATLRVGFAEPGDVLLTHKGSIGIVAKVQDDLPQLILTPQVTYYRVNPEGRLRRDFLFYALQTPVFRSRMMQLSKQSTRSFLSITGQRQLVLPLPPPSEQAAIERILRATDESIQAGVERAATLASLKSGLLQDLLTGKVRVSA